MKTSNWTAGFAAGVTLAASGVCVAEVGIMDGRDPFTNFQSNRTRAEVNQEYLDARAQGALPSGDIEAGSLNKSRADIGARGPAGSRYLGRTREEVTDELREYRRTHNPNDPGNLYFGG